MADNVTLDAGAGGATAATDDIGGIHYQRVKVTWGTDGTANDANASTPLPVTVASSTALTPGTAAANLGKAEDAAHASGDTGVAMLAVRRDTAAAGSGTDGDYSTINVNANGFLYTIDANSASALTALQAMQTSLAGTLTVGSHAVTNAGTFAVQAAQSGTWNIGTVTAVTAISNALPAGDNNIGNVDVVTLPALAAGTNNIGDVDVLSVIPGTAATNLGKAEDAAHASGDTGVMALAVRRDADTTLAATDGDYVPLQCNASGSLKVAITAGAGSGGTSVADGATFTRDTTSITPAGAAVESSAPTLTSGDVAALSMTTAGALRVAVASGGIAGVVEDAASAGGEEGVLMLGVRRDTAASSAGTDGDFATLNLDSTGRLHVNVGALPASTNTIEVVGDAAHDAAISGNPVRMAARALTSDYTAVSAGDTADLIATLLGKLVTMPYANPANTWSYAAASGGITNTTGVTAKTAAGAGVRNYVTRVQVINGHATVDTDVQIRDGASGTVLWRGFAKAAGGGVSAVFDPPLRGTANTLIEVANGTTGAATYFNLQGFAAAE